MSTTLRPRRSSILISRIFVILTLSSSISNSPGTILTLTPALSHSSTIRRISREDALAMVMMASSTPVRRAISAIWAVFPRT